MGKIVVAKLFRLGKDGDKFSKEYKKTIRERVIIDEDYVKEFNQRTAISGQMYEIDRAATDKRDEEVGAKKVHKKEADPVDNTELIAFLEGLSLDELKEYAGEMGISEDKIGAKKEAGIIKMIVAAKK